MVSEHVRTPFALVPAWVIERVTNPTALRYYNHIACRYANEKREAFPSEDRLAEDLGDSVSTAQRALRALRKADALIVTRTRRPDGSLSGNRYWLPMDDPRAHASNMTGGPDQGGLFIVAGQDQPSNMTGRHTSNMTGHEPDPIKQPDKDLLSSEVADATADGGADDQTAREDVEQLCVLLRDSMIANECKPPTITKTWRTEARLLLDKDKRPLAEAVSLLAWSQQHRFWKRNIHSLPKFREQYDKLRLQRAEEQPSNGPGSGSDYQSVRTWLLEMHAAGRSVPVVERSGLAYYPPPLPDHVTTKEQGVAFHADAVREWITANHEAIIQRILDRENRGAAAS